MPLKNTHSAIAPHCRDPELRRWDAYSVFPVDVLARRILTTGDSAKASRFSSSYPTRIDRLHAPELLLRRGRSLLASAGMVLHALLTLGLHFIPFLLLSWVKQRADLCVCSVVDIHHFRASILL